MRNSKRSRNAFCYTAKSTTFENIISCIDDNSYDDKPVALDIKTWLDTNTPKWSISIYEKNCLMELPVGDGYVFSGLHVLFMINFATNRDLALFTAKWAYLDTGSQSYIKVLRQNEHIDTYMSEGWEE